MWSNLGILKLIIIDEISMVGFKTLGKIDLIMKQVGSPSQPFGGVHFLFIGDLLYVISQSIIIKSLKKV